MYINISYKFHRIPYRQSGFIANVHDLLGQPSYMFSEITDVNVPTPTHISKYVYTGIT